LNNFHPGICRWIRRSLVRWWRGRSPRILWSDLYGSNFALVYGYSHAIGFRCWSRVFAGKHRMGRREVARLEDRCGGMMIQAVELKELPGLHFEPKIDYKSILPDWGCHVACAPSANHLYSVPSRNSLAERGTILGMYSVCMECLCRSLGRGDIMTRKVCMSAGRTEQQ
jgi:hypothetical protein